MPMQRLFIFGFFAVSLLTLLTACERKTATSTSPSAASASLSGASTDSQDSLMKEAFPSWGSSAGVEISVPTGNGKDTQVFSLTPLLVLTPNDQHRLLVVAGNSYGDAHAASGYLGLYGFTLSQGRWTKTSELPSFARSGEYGEVGEISRLDLGANRMTIAVKDRSCAQGHCDTRLRVFLLSDRAARLILDEPLSLGTNDEQPDPCDELVQAAAAGASTPEQYEGLSFSYCPATTGSLWVQKQERDEWPDIEIRFKGQDFSVDEASKAVKHTLIDERLVLRYNGETYVRSSGKNPLSRNE